MEKMLPVDGDQEKAPAEVAVGAASAEVAADADPAENRDPEADGWLNTVQHLLTWRHRRCQSDASDKIIRPEAGRMAQGWCNKSCVRGRGRDPPQKVAGPVEGQVDSMRLFLLQRGEGGHEVHGN